MRRKYFEHLKPGKILEILRTATFRQSGVTFGGTLINGILGAIFFILAARNLGPADFGLLSVTILFLTLLTSVGDLGTNTGLVRFAAKFVVTHPVKALRYFKLAFQIRFTVSLFILIAGWIFSETLAIYIFKKPEILLPLRIALIGVSGGLLFSFITSVLQTYQRFYSWSFMYIFTNTLRLILLLVAIFLNVASLMNVMLIYVSVLFIGFAIGLTQIGIKFIIVKGGISLDRNFVNYNFWIFGITVITATSSRLDSFISARYLSEMELGLYAAATQLVQVMPQIIAAIGTVVAPKIASMGSLAELKKYLVKIQIMVIGIALAAVVSIPLVKYLIPFLYGPDYANSAGIFVILLIAMLIFLIALPVHSAIIYYFSYPKLFFWLSLFNLAVIFVAGTKLIVIYGAIGAASAVLLSQLFNLVIPAFWVISKINRKSGKNL